ncbi:MAG: heparan-alpha-glucosaminide N-acetyltransferase domain-containing protein [Methanobrevibacter sp.]|jgi:predicted acyltransferase|nr:heparan-alpha-glucosaminide N-acetyltransferase domain-containing protein [Candidatus Methanovirga procula]
MLESKRRIVSLDVFRGFTVASMIFVNIIALTGETPYFLHHAEWEGIYFADLVFPFFLFIGGISMAFAFANEKNKTLKQRFNPFILRIILLFILGLFLNWIWSPVNLNVRIPGVLQLIDLSSLFASPFATTKPRWILSISIILILIHSIVLLFVGAPGIQPGTFNSYGNIAGWIDMQIIGSNHMLNSTFDPEGILALISSTALLFMDLNIKISIQFFNFNFLISKILKIFSYSYYQFLFI